MSKPEMPFGKKGYEDYAKVAAYRAGAGSVFPAFEDLPKHEQTAWDTTIRHAFKGAFVMGAFAGATLPTIAIVIFLAVKGLLTLL